MKHFLFQVLLVSIIVNLFFSDKINAQYMVNGKEVDTSFTTAMNRVFAPLNKSKIPFGILRDYAMEFTNLENFDGTALVDSNVIDNNVLREIYTTLITARMQCR